MTRVGKFAFGAITILAVGGAVCNGQGQSQTPVPKTVEASVVIDQQVALDADEVRKVISVDQPIAIIKHDTMFSWRVTVPAGHELEIDFRVQGGRKGPFARPGTGSTGRYVAGEGTTVIPAGPVALRQRGVYKYDVILWQVKPREDVAAIDPMIIDVE